MLPPFNVPFAQWPDSEEARAYAKSLLLVAVPFVAVGILVPAVLLVLSCCGVRRCKSRWPSAVLACGAVAAAGAAVAQSLAILDAAGEVTGDMLDIGEAAQQFVCSATSDSACNTTGSLMGFAQNLEDSTLDSVDEVAGYAQLLRAGVAGLPALANGVAANLSAVESLASDFNASLVSLDRELAELQRSLSTARGLGAPYFDVNPQAWAPLEAETQVPQLPPAALEQVAALGAQLEQEGAAVQQAVAGALGDGAAQLEAALGELCCEPGSALAALNASVRARSDALLPPLAELYRALDSSGAALRSAYRAAGLPLAVHAPTAPPAPPAPLRAPALACVVCGAALLLAPALLLLAAAWRRAPPRADEAAPSGAARKPPATPLCGCGVCCAVCAAPLLCALAAAALLLRVAAGAACAPGAVDAALQANLAGVGNVSLGAGLPPLCLARAVPAFLHCGEPGQPADAVALLGLAPLFDDAAAGAANFSAPLAAELARFNASAVQPALGALGAARRELPRALAAFNASAQLLAAPGAAALLDNASAVGAALAAMRAELPEGAPPASPLARWLAWYGAAAAPRPSAQLQATNDELRAALAAAAAAAAALPAALGACDAAAAAAAPLLAALDASLGSLQSEAAWALAQGEGLVAAVSRATDGLPAATAASACGWAGAGYAALSASLCDGAAPQLAPLSASLAACAVLLGLAAAALLCDDAPGAHAARRGAARDGAALGEPLLAPLAAAAAAVGAAGAPTVAPTGAPRAAPEAAGERVHYNVGDLEGGSPGRKAAAAAASKADASAATPFTPPPPYDPLGPTLPMLEDAEPAASTAPRRLYPDSLG